MNNSLGLSLLVPRRGERGIARPFHSVDRGRSPYELSSSFKANFHFMRDFYLRLPGKGEGIKSEYGKTGGVRGGRPVRAPGMSMFGATVAAGVAAWIASHFWEMSFGHFGFPIKVGEVIVPSIAAAAVNCGVSLAAITPEARARRFTGVA